jgi:hypothetical protein
VRYDVNLLPPPFINWMIAIRARLYGLKEEESVITARNKVAMQATWHLVLLYIENRTPLPQFLSKFKPFPCNIAQF